MEAPVRYVGRPLPRLEDRSLLTGAGGFIDDLERPGQLHARVVRSETAAGRIVSIDGAEALRRPGVVAVLTARDLPDALRIPIRLVPTEEARQALQPFLAAGVVRYVGEPVAVVLAGSPYAAEDAAADVRVDIAPEPVVTDPVAAAQPGSPAVQGQLHTNVVHTEVVRVGDDVDELLRGAPVVVEARLSVQRHTAVPLEPRGLLAQYDRDADALTIWGTTKVKHHNRRAVSELLQMPPERIRMVEPDVGGGFGPRGEIYPEDLLVPWLARLTGRPVKWIEDRQEHFVAVNHSREQECDIEIAATSDGQLLGLRATAWVDLGAYMRTNGAVLVLNTATHLPGPYRWTALETRALGVLTNKTPSGTYRGPGQFEPALHRERMLDVLARRLDIDPWELRRRNLVSRAEMPLRIETAHPSDPIVYDTGDFPLLWERLAECAGHRRLRERTQAARDRGELAGVGVAAFVEAGGRGPYEWARVVPHDDGTFVVHVGIAALGQGIATALCQIAADELGVPIGKVSVRHHDTDEITEGAGAFSSRSTAFGGNAVIGAVQSLFERARVAGAEALAIPGDRVEVVAGGIVRERDRPERARTFAQLGCEGDHRFEKRTRSFSMGAALAAVVLDRDTAAASVSDCMVVCDVGRAINPLIVRGQVVGAAAQAIGGALLEQLAYDERGQPLATSLLDYCMPTAAEIPPIEPVVLELPPLDRHATGLHVKGAGEVGIVGVGAAVANAIADAIGGKDALLTALPATPDRVRELIEGRAAASSRESAECPVCARGAPG